MKTITFDRKSPFWNNNIEVNKQFLHVSVNYLKDYILARGYLYLNTIYEAFGVRWNPDDENICYQADRGHFSIIWDEMGDNSFTVRIHY